MSVGMRGVPSSANTNAYLIVSFLHLRAPVHLMQDKPVQRVQIVSLFGERLPSPMLLSPPDTESGSGMLQLLHFSLPIEMFNSSYQEVWTWKISRRSRM